MGITENIHSGQVLALLALGATLLTLNAYKN